jgi:hypothetical protein
MAQDAVFACFGKMTFSESGRFMALECGENCVSHGALLFQAE